MPKESDILDRTWEGWREWVRSVTTFGFGPPKREVAKPAVKKRSGLKATLKPANNAELNRDLNILRRPKPKNEHEYEMVQMKRANPKITDFKKRPKTAEEKFVRRVNPPRPFDIDEKYLETPTERKDRVERFDKKKKNIPARFARPLMSKLTLSLLFLNLGTVNLLVAHRAFVNATEMPKSTKHLMSGLTFDSKN